MAHKSRIEIFYEDTDCGDVVYYANYLRYAERARTWLLEEKGLDFRLLMEQGIFFVISEATLKYLSPARYRDVLLVETEIERVGPASILFQHRIIRESTGERLVNATVNLACVGRDMKPIRLRRDLRDIIEAAAKTTGSSKAGY